MPTRRDRDDELRLEALRRREGHFTYAGGGFPLHLASYTVQVDAKPAMPHDGQIRQRLAAAGLEPTAERIEAYRAVAQTHLPLAMAAWEACDLKVIVTVGSDTHELRYTEAYRFLRHIGVLRRCDACQKDKYIPDLDSQVCSDCGYRTLDANAPRVGDLIAAAIGEA